MLKDKYKRMDGTMYLCYLKLFPTKRPNLVLWGNLCMWIAALGVNLWAVGRNYDSPQWAWVISFLIIVWCIFGIGHWSKLLWSKYVLEKELFSVPKQ